MENNKQIYFSKEDCIKRGFISRGKEIDYERGASAVLDDFRKGRMGRITLDEIDG